MQELSRIYNTQIIKDTVISDDAPKVKNALVGKLDAKLELKELTEEVAIHQVTGCLAMMLNTVVF